MIRVDHLNYEYPGKRALTDISFHIESGSITALVGPNGAGKTTLLKCLAALIRPFSGTIFINGTDILKYPRKCHKILGFLPDFFGLYDPLSVEQALVYFALAQNVPESDIRERVRTVVRDLNLEDRLGDRVGSLSRGMRQRLAMGQAMIHDPEVLLLDEPASGLDPEARYNLSRLFLKLNDAGKTLVVSSHILSELDQYATDLLILKEGRIVDSAISFGGSRIRRRMQISLVTVPDNIREILEQTEGVSEVAIDGMSVSLVFSGEAEGQYNLLKGLIDAGVAVREFYVKKQGVQEQYLETVAD